MKLRLLIILLAVSFSVTAQNPSKERKNVVEEQLPHFKGGDNAFFEYLDRAVKTPAGFDNKAYVKSHGNQYVPVSVCFTVDGTIKDVNVLEKVDEQLDEKAIEIVRNMPRWEPGTQNGKPVKVQYAIPVRFNLM